MNNDGWILPVGCHPDLQAAILSVPVFCYGAPNCLSWAGDHRFKRGFKSFLNDFYKSDGNVTWFKSLWHKHYALRFTIFGWLCFMEGLKTADSLIRRNILVSSKCCLCHNNNETIPHLFFECEFSFSILSKLLPQFNSFLLRPNLNQVVDYLDAMQYNSREHKDLSRLILWASIYYIWRERNDRKFSLNFKSSSTVRLTILKAVKFKLAKWKNEETLRILL
ncbi:hypothetical protein M5K25_027164 [Dendrobium thyrsiflorum]|uniref:Reverse transcriptase zinc-binding domain-containing protein n=1 Tax=Dendrobium thyrsiflorum TaxID=117978 RepID=A0ABD0TZB5_DENTH